MTLEETAASISHTRLLGFDKRLTTEITTFDTKDPLGKGSVVYADQLNQGVEVKKP